MTNTTQPQLGRPVNPNSARQQRIKELNEKREQGLCKRGRPVNGESKRQSTLKLREEKVNSGIELKRGRPVNPNSERQIRLSKKVVSE
jgi:hypothetical protein